MRNALHCKRMAWAPLAAAAAASLAGCCRAVDFPSGPLPARSDAYRAYDVSGDGSADFFLLAGADGRVDTVGYDDDTDGRPERIIHLDAVRFAQCRHFVIILDGFDYQLVKAYYDAGGLRVFHPPSRVIAPYPTMTDLCLEDALGYIPCRSYESLYYNRKQNKLAGGAWAYLTGKNQPYNRLLQYRTGLLWDAVSYVAPWPVFVKEVHDAKRRFDRAQTQEVLAYFVSSAGVGTRQGAEGQRRCLRRIEQLILQVLHETRGLTKFTLLADHGHSYTASQRLDIESYLKSKGWRTTKRLGRPKDVVCIPFGLVTFASFAANRPQALAADLAELEGVEVSSYAEKDTVVVLAKGAQRAVIHHKDGAFRYEALSGDPLKLKPLLAKLPGGTDGYHPADAMVRASVDHVYPAPLQRLWRAHFALVESPPDVLVSLANGHYYGASSFAGAVSIASTHGGLNRRNSVTFIMSSAGSLAPVMQSKDIPAQMRKLTGRRWPMGG